MQLLLFIWPEAHAVERKRAAWKQAFERLESIVSIGDRSVRAKLKLLHSPAVDDLENWRPGEHFSVLVQILVGPLDAPGEESFDVVVCSPSWLARELESIGIRSGRHMIFMREFDYRALKGFIERAIRAIDAKKWGEVGEKLGRLGHWEFEDYRLSP